DHGERRPGIPPKVGGSNSLLRPGALEVSVDQPDADASEVHGPVGLRGAHDGGVVVFEELANGVVHRSPPVSLPGAERARRRTSIPRPLCYRSAMAEGRGIRAAARRVVGHAKTLARLDAELARAEIRRKAGAAAVGLGMFVGAAVLGLFAVALTVALITAVIAIWLPVWASILIVLWLFILGAAMLAYLGQRVLKRAGAPVPTQAIAQAKRIGEAFRGRGSAVSAAATVPTE